MDRTFLYFDNTTDNGRESIADLDFVTSSDSVNPGKYAHLQYLHKFTSQAAEHHTARQCLNTFDAQQRCKEEGIDWLISIDADELVCTNTDEPSDLGLFFAKIRMEVDVVRFRTLEVLQRFPSYTNVFAEETLFKNNKQAYFKSIHNPFTNRPQMFAWWYGHTMGKAALRTERDMIPFNVHRYIKRDGTELLKKDCGNILHFHAYDREDFIKKFSNFADHPNTFLSGNKVEALKLLLRDVVNVSGMDCDGLGKYFVENLMFRKKEIDRFKLGKKYLFFKVNPTPIKEVVSVKKVFEKSIS